MDSSEYRKTLRDLFNTPNGKKILAHLYKTYVDSSAVGSSETKTYYNLGQKELVQDLLRDASSRPEDHVSNIIEGEFNDNFSF